MFYALNVQGKRVSIFDVETNQEYFCPICKEKLIQKRGNVNAWHFAHSTKQNCDEWYEMSEWHLMWQNRFPEKYREIVIDVGNEKHRADIRVGNIIIEFQNSTISGEHFEKRNNFYTSCGELVWVFNLQGKKIYEKKYKEGKTIQYQWDWAYKLNNLKSYDSKFDLFFQLKKDVLVKVVWNKQGFKFFGGYKYNTETFFQYLRNKYQKNQGIKKIS